MSIVLPEELWDEIWDDLGDPEFPEEGAGVNKEVNTLTEPARTLREHMNSIVEQLFEIDELLQDMGEISEQEKHDMTSTLQTISNLLLNVEGFALITLQKRRTACCDH